MTDQATPLATAADFAESPGFAGLVKGYTPAAADRLMLRATRAVESRCDRRLAPFTITDATRAEGIDPASAWTAGQPLDLAGALGRSKAAAYGTNRLVRDVWLTQYAPLYPDLWAYSNITVLIVRPTGDTQTVPQAALEGPEPTTGHLRVPIGTYVPEGATIRVTYTGGYTTVPDDLNTATCYTAAKLAILSAEPQLRSGMSLDELDTLILELLAPFIRA